MTSETTERIIIIPSFIYLRLPKQLFQVSAPNDQTVISFLALKFRDLFLCQLCLALRFMILLFRPFLGSDQFI